ncbi:hypothetical protein [Bacillus nakamurai]|uniref:hypothetical protein n=1 Tax=Bacillus nakamurai TaxID=1793963 RepID=UPI0020C35CAF|nr:hypothetical protein [Bacillus nakamurai]MCP6684170.1 hypothetical protein [Bacillus nakamurai]
MRKDFLVLLIACSIVSGCQGDDTKDHNRAILLRKKGNSKDYAHLTEREMIDQYRSDICFTGAE